MFEYLYYLHDIIHVIKYIVYVTNFVFFQYKKCYMNLIEKSVNSSEFVCILVTVNRQNLQ